jgi:hypothetical protein
MHLHGTGAGKQIVGRLALDNPDKSRASLGEISTVLQPSPTLSPLIIEDILKIY